MRFNLSVALSVALLLISMPAMAGKPARPTYVLVHGAFHGGWAWQRLADKLRDTQARVFTPTLTGVGDRAHLARPEVGLSTHVEDVVALLKLENLHDVILVGHSYGGMVITGVAAAVPERIGKLVYFDAVVPESGESFFEAIEFGEELPPDLWLMPSFPPQAFGLTHPKDIAYVGERLRAQPVATLEEPLTFDWAALAQIPKSYIHCTGEWFARETFLRFRARAQARGWDYYEIKDSHSAMVTSVQETNRVLRRIER